MSEIATVTEQRAGMPLAKVEQVDTHPSLIDWKAIWKPLSLIAGAFLIFFWLPIDHSRFAGAVIESLALAKWYAQEHVLLCLVPAFFIAGATVKELAYILALTMREAAGGDDCWTHGALGDYKTLISEGLKSSECCAK